MASTDPSSRDALNRYRSREVRWDLCAMVRSPVGYHPRRFHPGLRIHQQVSQQHLLQEQTLGARQGVGVIVLARGEQGPEGPQKEFWIRRQTRGLDDFSSFHKLWAMTSFSPTGYHENSMRKWDWKCHSAWHLAHSKHVLRDYFHCERKTSYHNHNTSDMHSISHFTKQFWISEL